MMSKIVFPELSAAPQKGEWYRVTPRGAVISDGTQFHFEVRPGTENNILILLHGGGMSCNEYMAARPTNLKDYGEVPPGFYFGNMSEIADAMLLSGITDTPREDNPFRSWTLVGVPYSTGDCHCGTGDFQYTSVKGEEKILYHHGYTNFMKILETVKTLVPQPNRIVVSGYSAGAFGASLLTDSVMNYFPDCGDVTCIADSALAIRDNWPEVVEKVWKAPEEIARRIHSNNIALDVLQALKKDHGDRVRILYICSIRDNLLAELTGYARTGKRDILPDTVDRFQEALAGTCREIQATIPGAGIYLFDQPARDPAEVARCRTTRHTILHSPDAFSYRMEGKTVVEWIKNEMNGVHEHVGLNLL